MLRQLSRLLALVVLTTAALVPGAAVFVLPATAFSCAAEPPPLAIRIHESSVIAIGAIESGGAGGFQLRPEAFLKGPARPDPLPVIRPAQEPECPLANLSAGDRAMLFLGPSGSGFGWPDAAYAYVLKDGHARLTGDVVDDHLESQLVADVRSVTNLYAVPATDTSETAGIDWMKTVLPVAGALVLVFGIGLLFMRTWHRIDPT